MAHHWKDLQPQKIQVVDNQKSWGFEKCISGFKYGVILGITSLNFKSV